MAAKYKVLRKILAVLLSLTLMIGMAPELATAEGGGADGMMGIAAASDLIWGAGGLTIDGSVPQVTVTLTNDASGTLDITNTAVTDVIITGVGTVSISQTLTINANNAAVVWDVEETIIT
ncbi:MAG: hypothetical protein FWD90_13860 [Defluviitaleaceae bacterium]|nr:hypothetical protein [Defluviitaleaceae bacterium]